MKREKVDDFYEEAKEYCYLIDNNTLNLENVSTYITTLMKLYIHAVELPFGDNEYIPESVENQIQEMRRKSRWNAKTELEDHYVQTFNPFNSEDELDYYIITGDLSEIYEDMKEGIILYENGYKYQAMWEWGFGCYSHWGRHLTSVLRPLHSLWIDDEVCEELKKLDQ